MERDRSVSFLPKLGLRKTALPRRVTMLGSQIGNYHGALKYCKLAKSTLRPRLDDFTPDRKVRPDHSAGEAYAILTVGVDFKLERVDQEPFVVWMQPALAPTLAARQFQHPDS